MSVSHAPVEGPAPAKGPPPAAAETAKAGPSFIAWTALTLMTVSAVASLRPAPTMAVYGLACVFLYLLPAVVFLIPTALVSAELASGWSGGVYRWVSEGVSPRMGFTAAWHQYAMTLFYYPSLLSFVAATLAYVIAPDLASSGVWTAVVIISVYWAGVLLSLRGGIGVVAKLASSGVLIGTMIPGVLLVGLGIAYLLQGNPSAAPMTASHLLPEWTGIASIVLIVSNFAAYAGMEMNAVHVNELRKPSKEFPKAIFIAALLVLLILVLPPLAISWVVPAENVSLTAGVMQAFDAVLAHFGMQWLTPVIGLAIVAATLAGFLTWLSGPSKSLLLVGREGGYLPPYFQKTNDAGVQVNILVSQGILTTGLALLFAFVPAVSNAYWIFMTITTSVYLLMYLSLFAAAFNLRKRQPDHPRGYRAPALPLLCAVGFVSSVAAIAISFVPPSQLGAMSTGVYVAAVGGGLLLLGLVVPVLFLWRRKPSWRAAGAGAPEPVTVTVPEAVAPEPATVTIPEAGPAAVPVVVSTSAVEPAPSPTPPPRRRRGLYWVTAGVLVVLLAVMLGTFRYHRSNTEAEAKAQQLVTAFQQAGLPTPHSTDQIVRVLGNDGGAVCATADSKLVQAYWKLRLGVGGEFGYRPVIVDKETVQGLRLVVQTYCPDKLTDVQTFLDNLNYDNVINK